MHLTIRILAIVSLLAAAACTMSGARLSENVTPLRKGVEQANEQTALAFSRTNEMAQELNIVRAVDLKRPVLREADFPVAIAYEDRDRWVAAFGALDSYLGELQKLVDPARSAQTTTGLDALAKQLQEGSTELQLPGPTVAAFNTFAGALVQVSAERKALAVMQQTDPAFNEVVNAMAKAIGDTNADGLRLTVRSYWASKLADINVDYSKIASKPSADEKRRGLILQYTSTIEARDGQLRDLAALGSSLTALGQAHNAAARGDGSDALFWIDRISGWLDEAKKRAKEAADKDAEQKGADQ